MAISSEVATFFKAVRDLDFKTVESMLSRNKKLANESNATDYKPLTVVARAYGMADRQLADRVAMLELLLENGADINAGKETPLYSACRYDGANSDQSAIIKWLLEHNADVSIAAGGNEQRLRSLKRNGGPAVIQALENPQGLNTSQDNSIATPKSELTGDADKRTTAFPTENHQRFAERLQREEKRLSKENALRSLKPRFIPQLAKAHRAKSNTTSPLSLPLSPLTFATTWLSSALSLVQTGSGYG